MASNDVPQNPSNCAECDERDVIKMSPEFSKGRPLDSVRLVPSIKSRKNLDSFIYSYSSEKSSSFNPTSLAISELYKGAGVDYVSDKHFIGLGDNKDNERKLDKKVVERFQKREQAANLKLKGHKLKALQMSTPRMSLCNYNDLPPQARRGLPQSVYLREVPQQSTNRFLLPQSKSASDLPQSTHHHHVPQYTKLDHSQTSLSKYELFNSSDSYLHKLSHSSKDIPILIPLSLYCGESARFSHCSTSYPCAKTITVRSEYKPHTTLIASTDTIEPYALEQNNTNMLTTYTKKISTLIMNTSENSHFHQVKKDHNKNMNDVKYASNDNGNDTSDDDNVDVVGNSNGVRIKSRVDKDTNFEKGPFKRRENHNDQKRCSIDQDPKDAECDSEDSNLSEVFEVSSPLTPQQDVECSDDNNKTAEVLLALAVADKLTKPSQVDDKSIQLKRTVSSNSNSEGDKSSTTSTLPSKKRGGGKLGRRRKRGYIYDPKPLVPKTKTSALPNDLKDEEYWTRRQRNNEAAKRSRENRRVKELETMNLVKRLTDSNVELKEKIRVLELRNIYLEKVICESSESSTSGSAS